MGSHSFLLPSESPTLKEDTIPFPESPSPGWGAGFLAPTPKLTLFPGLFSTLRGGFHARP